MIRTGNDYRESIRDGREVYINGEKVADVTAHPQFKPLVDIRAQIFDMAHDPATRDVMTVTCNGEVNAVGNALPYSQSDWWAKRRAADAVMDQVGGVVTRVGDETVGEMWSLHDASDVLADMDPQFARNIEAHIGKDLQYIRINGTLVGGAIGLLLFLISHAAALWGSLLAWLG